MNSCLNNSQGHRGGHCKTPPRRSSWPPLGPPLSPPLAKENHLAQDHGSPCRDQYPMAGQGCLISPTQASSEGHLPLELPARLAEASVWWQSDFCLCAILTLSPCPCFPRRCGGQEHSLTNVCTLISTSPGLPALSLHQAAASVASVGRLD